MKKKYKIGFFGDDVWAHKTLNYLLKDKSIKIEFICGRYKSIDKKLKKIAMVNNIKFLKIKNVNDDKFINKIIKKEIDLLISMSFDQIFKKKIINLFSKKIVNCHAGKLPFYRGRSVLNWVLINGEKNFGITTHFINHKIDTGNILNQKIIKIEKKDDYKSLLFKSYKECSKILYKTIKQIQNNKYKSIPQTKISKKSSYFKRRKKGDEILNLKIDSKKIQNFVKGLVRPGPLARIKLNKNEIFIEKVTILKNKLNNSEFSIFFKKNKLYFPTVDKKMIRVDKWYSKFRINKNSKLGVI